MRWEYNGLREQLWSGWSEKGEAYRGHHFRHIMGLILKTMENVQ